MSSIRPLVTITILVVAGVFLYVKINEGPVKQGAANEAWQSSPSEGVPPLGATADSVPATTGSAAPAWPTTAVAPTPTPAPLADSSPPLTTTTSESTSSSPPATGGNALEKLPAVPEIPELPDLPKTVETEVPAQFPVAPPTSLPDNIPTARYPDQPAATSTPESPLGTTEAPITGGADTVGLLNPTSPTAAPLSEPPLVPVTPAPPLTNPLEVAASNAAPPMPETESINPLRQSPAQAEPLAQPDRYAATNTAPNQPVAETTPITPAAATASFASAWPAIQAALDRGELARAHQMLSPFHNDPSLTPADSQKVEALLGQLAGTVVYSTEHQLGPAHVVKPGETLETIANEYNVPWQLLAKINGIPAADQLRPGQELKVVKGPFSAEVDLRRNELSLTVDGRYAGKFPVTSTPDQSIADGEWVVGKKSNEQAPGKAILLQGNPAAPNGPQPTIVVVSESAAVNSADGNIIKVSPQDAAELTDILSIGSRVVIRR